MKTITFFNNKGGVGKTTMVYHLTWMLSELNYKVVAADLDPQSNLTSMFLPLERLEEIFEKEGSNQTVLGSLKPVVEGEGYEQVHLERIGDNIGLVVGDLELSTYEDNLSDAWLKTLDGDVHAFKKISIFNSIIKDAANQINADVALIDVGPNLGAINRAVTISSEFIVMPVASDLFSLQGIKNLGNTLHLWKSQWQDRRNKNPKPEKTNMPEGNAIPAGYLLLQYTAKKSNQPVKSYMRWADRIPKIYQQYVLRTETQEKRKLDEDPNCLGLLKHYHSLAPMSMESNKPMFLLKPADGAIGSHVQAVQKCYEDFEELAKNILNTCETFDEVIE